MRNVEKRPLIPQKMATRCMAVRSRRSTWVLMLEPGRFGALGSWVHPVRGDGNEPGCWPQPELYTVSYGWEENLKWDIHTRRSSSVLDKFPGAGRDVTLWSETVRHLSMLLDLGTPKICKMGRGEWTLVCCTIYSVLENIVEDVLLSTPKLLVGF